MVRRNRLSERKQIRLRVYTQLSQNREFHKTHNSNKSVSQPIKYTLDSWKINQNELISKHKRLPEESEISY